MPVKTEAGTEDAGAPPSIEELEGAQRGSGAEQSDPTPRP
jgi:hypothetical protein